MKHWPFYILLILLYSACQQLRPLLHRTERGKYESSFRKDDSLFAIWKASHNRAMTSPLQIELPYQATVRIGHQDASAMVYAVPLKQGMQLVAEIRRPSDTKGLFLELFSAGTAKSDKMLTELSVMSNKLVWQSAHDDTVRISFQPRLNDSTVYHLKIYTLPAYNLPVAGKGNSAIQSFWGADRDGGARRHEGIDIFAQRGTPVLAVADGQVGFAGERGRLGGKQVWLKEKLLGLRVYYAHLDSIVVQTGQQVLHGDTLGFVGNTGNAVGGPPHLHFGVYGNTGAVDPLNFVKSIAIPTDREYDTAVPVKLTKGASLRSGPGKSYPELLNLAKGEQLKVLAQTRNWLHVVVRDTVSGFIPRS